MSLTKFNGVTNNIQGLADKPTQTASQLKTLFDKTGDDLKTYINGTLTTEIDTELGNKANSNNVYTKTEIDNKLSDSGWQDLTVSASGFSSGQGKYRKIGKLVEVLIFMTRGNTDYTSAYATTIATLPEGYRSSYDVHIVASTNAYNKKFQMKTGNNGTIAITLLDDKIPAYDSIRGAYFVYMV